LKIQQEIIVYIKILSHTVLFHCDPLTHYSPRQTFWNYGFTAYASYDVSSTFTVGNYTWQNNAAI